MILMNPGATASPEASTTCLAGAFPICPHPGDLLPFDSQIPT